MVENVGDHGGHCGEPKDVDDRDTRLGVCATSTGNGVPEGSRVQLTSITLTGRCFELERDEPSPRRNL
jgi:hypothetical protein